MKYLIPSTLLALLLLTVGCSSIKYINKKLDRNFSENQVLENSYSGLAIYDPEIEKMLYEHNSKKYFTPASNTKLFTFYTGLKVLGDSVPALEYTVKNDSLIFKGTGDPSFLNPALPSGPVIDFLKKAKEELYFVSPNYIPEHFGPGWAWDDFNYSFSPERATMPIYGNTVVFKIQQDNEIHVTPSIFRDSVKISPIGEHPFLKREIASNTFKLHPEYRTNSRKIPFKYSETTFLMLLEDSLKRKVNLIKSLPPNFKFKKLYGIPMDSLYLKMLQDSDNFIAEQILLMAAGKLSDTLKAEIAIEHMKEKHLKDLPDRPVWVDGSGLSRYNLFTPSSMVSLLQKIRREIPDQKLFSLLPAGGKTGTLEDNYEAEEPYIYAKTGTMSNNHSLSGFLRTSSGKILIFSFMNSNYVVPTSEIKEAMENILKMVRDNY